jgi:hypothetical protein
LKQKEEFNEELEQRTEQIRAKLQDDCSLWQQKYEQVAASYHKVKHVTFITIFTSDKECVNNIEQWFC